MRFAARSNRSATYCLISFVVVLALAGDHIVSANGTSGAKLTGELPKVLEQAGPDELIPVSIALEDQLTGEWLRARAVGATDGRARRRMLVEALKKHAARTQAGLRDRLEHARFLGQADRIRFLWIGNIVAARLTPDQIVATAALDVVDHINWAPKLPALLGPQACFDRMPSNPSLAPGFSTDAAGTDAVECGVETIQAPRVWNELGNTGSGAVIAVIDSGVCWNHPDIEDQIWVNPGEDVDGDGVVMDWSDLNGIDDDRNGYVDDLMGYDFADRDYDPNDDHGHGSHVAGSVAGDGTSGTEAGVAPDAKIMVLKVGGPLIDEPDVWEAMQYAAENGADSISMSLGWPHEWYPDRTTWRVNCDNTIDLGTAMVVSAGNGGSGNDPDNIGTPGDVPRVITVGATDCSDAAADFSSRGPVTWEDVTPWNDYPYPPGLVKPDVSAPGVDISSHAKCDGYLTMSGTSMATPHVAGTVALMISENPALRHDDLKLILEDTSVDLGVMGKDRTFGAGRVDAYEAVLRSQTSDGVVYARQRVVACGGVLSLVVTDRDLRGTGTQAVWLTSDTETSAEVVHLVESAESSGVFRGEIATDDRPPAPDGVLQVEHGDIVTVTYVDADDGMGGTDVPKTDTTGVDCHPPVISQVESVAMTETSVVIRWQTDEVSDGGVAYGDAVPPGEESFSGGFVTDHSIALDDLWECTIYHFSVNSEDPAGNRAEDDNGGAYFRFETPIDLGEGLQACHGGLVSFDVDAVACESTLPVRVSDFDLNQDSDVAETVDVAVTSSTETKPEIVTLTETGPDTARFTGSLSTAPGPAVTGDGVLQLTDGDLVTARYEDADNGTGSPDTSTDTVPAVCSGALFESVVVTAITHESAVVEWTTSRPTTGQVDWGTTPALGNVETSPSLETGHNVQLESLPECGRVYFRVHAVDTAGNPSVADAGGAPFGFNASEALGIVFRDQFEIDKGWILQGEWEIDAPRGLGRMPGDPIAAPSGSRVLGHDLSGLGDHPGDYEPRTQEFAESPSIDASHLSNAELAFKRWLNAAAQNWATIQVRDAAGSWNVVWGSDSLNGHSEWQWSSETLDISSYADGNPDFRVRFAQSYREADYHAGWNIDDLAIRDATQPEYRVCGGCAGAPTFAGVVSVADDDPCAGSGVTLTWVAAPSWGTGGGGTYAVYRDTVPEFVPGVENLLASGIEATTWTDPSPPADRTLYYVVRAENDETCSSGPANGGVTDDNRVYATVINATHQPWPGEVGNTLMVAGVNRTHLQLEWEPTPGASKYHVYRAASPDETFDLDEHSNQTVFEYPNVFRDGETWYYTVRAVDACGNEGP